MFGVALIIHQKHLHFSSFFSVVLSHFYIAYGIYGICV